MMRMLCVTMGIHVRFVAPSLTLHLCDIIVS